MRSRRDKSGGSLSRDDVKIPMHGGRGQKDPEPADEHVSFPGSAWERGAEPAPPAPPAVLGKLAPDFAANRGGASTPARSQAEPGDEIGGTPARGGSAVSVETGASARKNGRNARKSVRYAQVAAERARGLGLFINLWRKPCCDSNRAAMAANQFDGAPIGSTPQSAPQVVKFQ